MSDIQRLLQSSYRCSYYSIEAWILNRTSRIRRSDIRLATRCGSEQAIHKTLVRGLEATESVGEHAGTPGERHAKEQVLPDSRSPTRCRPGRPSIFG